MPKYPKLSQILKKLLYERDMKPIDLAREVNIPQPTIHRLVSGKSSRPYKSSLEPIADYFAISIDQLLGIEEADENSKKLLRKQNINTIPILAWDNLNSPQIGRKNSKQSILVNDTVGKNAFAAIMPDSSMEPLFNKGSTLIFDPDIKPTDRCYVLVNVGKNKIVIFRQLLIDADYQYLKPLNPDLNHFQMRLLKEDDVILANLVESRNTFLNNDYLLDRGEGS